jgi:hypothetical protein
MSWRGVILIRSKATSTDGSKFTTPNMAIHMWSEVQLPRGAAGFYSQGGGVGWSGEVINGGFGMVLDGSRRKLLKSWKTCFSTMWIWGWQKGAGLQVLWEAIQRQMYPDARAQVTIPGGVRIVKISLIPSIQLHHPSPSPLDGSFQLIRSNFGTKQ